MVGLSFLPAAQILCMSEFWGGLCGGTLRDIIHHVMCFTTDQLVRLLVPVPVVVGGSKRVCKRVFSKATQGTMFNHVE